VWHGVIQQQWSAWRRRRRRRWRQQQASTQPSSTADLAVAVSHRLPAAAASHKRCGWVLLMSYTWKLIDILKYEILKHAMLINYSFLIVTIGVFLHPLHDQIMICYRKAIILARWNRRSTPSSFELQRAEVYLHDRSLRWNQGRSRIDEECCTSSWIWGSTVHTESLFQIESFKDVWSLVKGWSIAVCLICAQALFFSSMVFRHFDNEVLIVPIFFIIVPGNNCTDNLGLEESGNVDKECR